jgi:hypothetical protein
MTPGAGALLRLDGSLATVVQWPVSLRSKGVGPYRGFHLRDVLAERSEAGIS